MKYAAKQTAKIQFFYVIFFLKSVQHERISPIKYCFCLR